MFEQYDYEAFGKPFFYNPAGTEIPSSAWNNRYLGKGREWLKELKLYDYRHRLYQPELGRFLQPDPKHFAAGDYNLYRYCHNDPVNKSDPLGLFEYEFSKDYPQEARQRVINAMNLGATTERGQQLKNMEPGKTITFAPTSDSNPNTGAQGDTIFLNPKDALFLDPESRRLFTTKYRNELPPNDDRGRATMIYHEVGHPIDKQKDENKGGKNVQRNENPVRAGLGVPARRQYSGHPVSDERKPKEKK